MGDSVNKRLSSLSGMNKEDLSKLWREMFETTPSSHLRRPLMVQILAYRIQEEAFGGLNSASRRQLLQMAQTLKARPKAQLCERPGIKPGTRLIRQWDNRVHVVTVKDRSYEYAGSEYRSLSEIARLITGTQWSGPLFFGLKDKQKQKQEQKQQVVSTRSEAA
jgi:hypothetical protein